MTELALSAVGLATLQDAGRGRYAAVGVPRSGAWDTRSFATLCALVGSDAWPVIEAWSGDVAWTVPEADVAFAVSGPARVLVDGVASGAPLTVLSAPAGATVTVARSGPGPVMVLVPGLRAPRVLGSASCDSLSGLGGPPLAPGRTLPLDLDAQAETANRIGAFARDADGPRTTLDAVLHGPLGEHLPDRGWVVADVARSGVRLRPESAAPAWAAPAWSSGPVLPGVVQVPPDGCPIVLGPDAGTTGGYPVAGVLTASSLCALAYAAPGAVVRIRSVVPPVVEPPVAGPVRW